MSKFKFKAGDQVIWRTGWSFAPFICSRVVEVSPRPVFAESPDATVLVQYDHHENSMLWTDPGSLTPATSSWWKEYAVPKLRVVARG